MRRLLTVCAAAALAAAALADKIDDFARAEMARQHIPGLTLGVIKDGKLVKTAAYGQSDLELPNKTTLGDVFEIGSCTKQFTAFATLLLRDEGKLKLDDPVSKWIPESPKSWDGITLRHLLYQISGLQDYALVPGIGIVDEFDRKTWFDKMTALPLDFAPGVAWAYSNTNYALLGYVVEKAAGVPYAQFVTDRIFKPLGMTHTLFVDPYAIIPRRAHGFMINEGQVIRAAYSGRGINSDGTIASTIADLAKWDEALRERKLLSPEGYRLMWSRATLNSGRTRGYGTGWFLNQPWEPEYVGHAGNSSGFSAGIARFTKANVSVVVLCNLYPVSAEALAKQIAAIYDPKLKVQPPASTTDPDPARSAKVSAAVAKLATGNPDDSVMEPELTAPMKTGRARMFPSPFRALAKVDRMSFAGEQSQDSDRWLIYRVETPAQNFVLRVLWTGADKIASAALSADGPRKDLKK